MKHKGANENLEVKNVEKNLILIFRFQGLQPKGSLSPQ